MGFDANDVAVKYGTDALRAQMDEAPIYRPKYNLNGAQKGEPIATLPDVTADAEIRRCCSKERQ